MAWCVALRGLGWPVLCGCAAAVVGRSEAERGGATSCLRWTAGVAAPVAQAAVAVAVSPPWVAAGLLRALLVWGVVWCVVGVWVCVRCGVCGVDVCVAGWVGVGVCVGVFVFVEGGGGGGGRERKGRRQSGGRGPSSLASLASVGKGIAERRSGATVQLACLGSAGWFACALR